jgi:hypothetical protein
MPKIVVEGPDGRKFAFPDTMPRAEINAFMKQKYGTKARDESVQDYLARFGREQAATEARAKDIDREATAAGRAEGERAAERMGVDNPFLMAFAAPAIGIAQQEGGRQVFNREGTVLADEAAGLAAANSAGFFVPGLVNPQFGARVEEGRRQQPLAAFAGDIAGGYGPGEIIGAGVAKAAQAIGPSMAAVGRMFSRGPGPNATNAIAGGTLGGIAPAETAEERARNIAVGVGLGAVARPASQMVDDLTRTGAPRAMPDAMPAGAGDNPYFGRQSMRPPGSGPSAREIETQQQWATATPIVTQARTTAQSAQQEADAALQSKAPADIARAKDQKKTLVGQIKEAQASRAGMDTPEDARLAETLASLTENTSDPVLLSTQISAAKTSLDRLLTDIGSPSEGNLIPVRTNILTRTQAPRSAAEGPQDRASVTRYAAGTDEVKPQGFGAGGPKTPEQGGQKVLPPPEQGRVRLFNAGTLDRDPGKYIEPHVSDWVNEIAAGAGDFDDLSEITKPLIYLSDEPEKWLPMIVGRKIGKHPTEVTLDDIRQHGRLNVVDADPEYDTIYKVGDFSSDEKVTRLDGERVKWWETDLYDSEDFRDMPVGPEPNDFISRDAAEISQSLTGNDLVEFMQANGFKDPAAKPPIKGMGFGAGTPKTPQQAVRFETPGSPEWEAAKAKGLDMSQAGRMARAKEWQQSRNTNPELVGARVFRGVGTRGDRPILPELIDPERARYRTSTEGQPVVFVTESPDLASEFADIGPTGLNDTGAVFPLMVRGEMFDARNTDHVMRLRDSMKQSAFQTDTSIPLPERQKYLNDAIDNMFAAAEDTEQSWQYVEILKGEIQDAGFDGFRMTERGNVTFGIFDPSNIRSVNAAFDPEKSGSSTLLAAAPFATVSGAGLTSERELGSKMKDDTIRADGTKKDTGFLGPLKRPDGMTMTEYSVGVNIDGRDVEIPTLVPTLTQEEIDLLLNLPDGDKPPRAIINKAIDHARGRIKNNKSPFWNPQDDGPRTPKEKD